MKKQFFQQFGFSKTASIILITVVILVGIGGGFFYFKKYKIAPVPPPVTPTPTPVIPTEIILAKRLIKPEDIVLEKVMGIFQTLNEGVKILE